MNKKDDDWLLPLVGDLDEISEEARRKRALGRLSDTDFSEILDKALRRAGFQNIELAREVLQLRQTLARETDRGAALLVGAYLDEMLVVLLAEFFVDDEKIRDEFLAPAGPLGSFSAKIDMSYALGLISPQVRSSLHSVRKIRNEFAHVSGDLTFRNDKIESRCLSLCADSELAPRQRFTRAALRLVGSIYASIQETQHREAASERPPSPEAANAVQRLHWAIEDETDSHYFERALHDEENDDEAL